jgi:hypothetical protein
MLGRNITSLLSCCKQFIGAVARLFDWGHTMRSKLSCGLSLVQREFEMSTLAVEPKLKHLLRPVKGCLGGRDIEYLTPILCTRLRQYDLSCILQFGLQTNLILLTYWRLVASWFRSKQALGTSPS